MSASTNDKTGRQPTDQRRTTAPPHLGVDPFSIEFFDDPYPTHALLRDAGQQRGASADHKSMWMNSNVTRFLRELAALERTFGLTAAPAGR